MATWFITGCSTGIGNATAREVASAGHTVVATARRVRDLDALVADFPAGRIVPIVMDVTDDASVADGVEAARSAAGTPDVVVNNAGIGLFGTIEDNTDAQARAVMEANFWGAARVTTAWLPWLRERRSGHVLTVGSIAGIRGSAGLGYYCASKFAVAGFMEALAAEVAHLGIKVTLIEPGPVRSQWILSGEKHHDVTADYAAVMEPFWNRIDSLPGNQPGSPEALAKAMLSLVNSPNPPLHFVAGAHAIAQTKAKIQRLGDEVAAWEGLGIGVDKT